MTTKTRQRCGVTLVELLVVVAIAVLLVATAVPLMKPALQDSKLRESSRQLNVFIQVARARAMETGRTAAIRIERSAPGSNAAFQVYIAQTPLPYTGDTLTATGTIAPPSGSSTISNTINFNAESATLPGLVRPGDVIKFDYKGKFYEITSVNATLPSITVSVSTAHTLPPSGVPLRYQIFRRPQRSLLPPLQFTGNTVIDLQYSGIGRTSTFDSSGNELGGREFQAQTSTDVSPVVIAFNSAGAVDHISYFGSTATPTGLIHLLIGRNDQVGDPVADVPPDAPNPIAVTSLITAKTHQYSKNVADPANVWITINPNTGAVSSAENAWQVTTLTPSTPVNFEDSFLLAREFAQSAQSIGGR